VIVIGGTEERLKMCRSFGATLFLNRHRLSSEERRKMILEATEGGEWTWPSRWPGSPKP